ncbi:MAG TPA: site-2 protease family protein, partial [Candidatus Acidoferrales bacterium]|nr:site-2 protease family protein [Candidatus Acidoferrales bacterium]
MPQPTTGLRIGRILGIPLYLHATSFLIFALLTFFLATQILPLQSGATPMQYWILAVGVSIVFFGSLILHELGHSIIALRYKIPVVSITLFFFGGLARIARDPETALQEFNIAIAGPIVSFMLGAAFLGIYAIAPSGVLQLAALYLSEINLILGAFNLLPGFPMDGGRVLRAIVWGITKNFDRATQIASRSGQIFAYMMIMLGIWAIMERDSGVSRFL